MLSRIIPLEYLKERDVMFWLPPGGQDNEIWADTWVIIAELDAADADPVLDLLRDNDIGGYIATPSGRRGAPGPGRQLYVDREQHSKAADVLMLFLRSRNQPALPAGATRRPARSEPAVHTVRPGWLRVLVITLKIVAGAAFIALFLLLMYHQGPRLFPTVHPPQHPVSNTDAPAMTDGRP
ncbi:hypothetical protein [Mycobacterium sp. shizuoka-1]|uniref:hypothetical protein n=1 Tax=Mycobacterium sp. shizuoka-1 TaxID=2039281 RepID=UPI000C0653A4|nr:hypothetical protein [Mycobacterium sp. shizuoka-1]GAY14589.1 hypothetical protein MSZK_13150 [Mycobacterium sp. shizuoka-1]